MTVKVYIPTPFRALTEKQARVEVHPGTVGDALQELESRYPGMRERLRDPQGPSSSTSTSTSTARPSTTCRVRGRRSRTETR